MWPLLVFALILAAVFGVGHGILGALIGFAAGVLIYLGIGALLAMGRTRD